VVVVLPHVYVFYDIPDDRVRLKVANVLKDFGLNRLQKSVFEGDLTYNRAHELSLVLDRVIGDAEGDVRIIFVPFSFVDKVIVVRELYSVSEELVVVK
jgi:CRISPR-associated endonuclease Cas2